MTELPYFKFHPEQWLAGDISYTPFDIQGAFATTMAHYWANQCVMTYGKLLLRLGSKENLIKKMIEYDLIIKNDDQISIKFLDEQYNERIEQHNKNIENGRLGGLKSSGNKAKLKSFQAGVKQGLSNTQAGVNQGLSNTQALRKEKIKEEKIKKDNKRKDNKIKEKIKKMTDEEKENYIRGMTKEAIDKVFSPEEIQILYS